VRTAAAPGARPRAPPGRVGRGTGSPESRVAQNAESRRVASRSYISLVAQFVRYCLGGQDSLQPRCKPGLEPSGWICFIEKPVHIYSNTELVVLIRNADELKMFACDDEDARAITLLLPASAKQHAPGAPGPDRGPETARVAELPSRRVARFSRVAESRVAAARLGATRQDKRSDARMIMRRKRARI
jgi:hypothetical protein